MRVLDPARVDGGPGGADGAAYDVGEEQIYIFKNRKGRDILGVYSDIQMKDVVVIARAGIVREVIEAKKGEGMTIIGAYMAPIFAVGNMQ